MLLCRMVYGNVAFGDDYNTCMDCLVVEFFKYFRVDLTTCSIGVEYITESQRNLL